MTSASPPGRIIVRAPNWLGDAALSLCAVRDVRKNFPEARIEVVARPWVADLYRAVREIDGVREASRFTDFVAAARGFDVAILLPNSFGSALQVVMARVPERWGYAGDGRRPLLTRKASVPPGVRSENETFRYRALLAGVGLRVSGALNLRLRCPDEWKARAAVLLAGNERWIGLNPGASFGCAKRWLPERYAEVGDALAARLSASVAIVGSAAERSLGESIAERMSVETRLLCGRTDLAELVGVLSSLCFFVTNDSGPMHVAAALDVPLVAIFGPTDWRETAPFSQRSRLVREPVECAPCKLRRCPIDHRCMKSVSVERVLGAADSLLSEIVRMEGVM
ncbi:MAG: lipopolysaccharide heptosyltransferase II [Vicinamibacteria bacterium]|nr:lipopolysaccharide heptosyltransferase II [Vicinamibacteria bacterium]